MNSVTSLGDNENMDIGKRVVENMKMDSGISVGNSKKKMGSGKSVGNNKKNGYWYING